MAERLTDRDGVYRGREKGTEMAMFYKLSAYEDLGTVEELTALKERTRWISVSERLPEREMCCLVYQSAFVGFVDIAHYYLDTKQFYVGGYPCSDIDYWMPLPEAQKEK